MCWRRNEPKYQSLSFRDRAAHAEVQIAVDVDDVAVLAHAARDLIVGDIAPLQVLVLVVGVEVAVKRVAARLADEHLHHTGRPHLGALGGSLDVYLVKRAVVVIEADRAAALEADDPLDRAAWSGR